MHACRLMAADKQQQDEINTRLRDRLNSISNSSYYCRRESDMHPTLLRFLDASAEHSFSKQSDHMFSFYVIFAFIIFLVVFVIQAIMLPRSALFFVTSVLGILVYTVLVAICVYSDVPLLKPCHKYLHILLHTSKLIIHTAWIRVLLSLCSVGLIFFISTITMVDCEGSTNSNRSSADGGSPPTYIRPGTSQCSYPTFYLLCFLLAFTGYSVFIQISFVIKFIFVAIMFIIVSLAVHVGRGAVFDEYDSLMSVLARGPNVVVIPLRVKATVYMVLVMATMHYLDREMEYANRVGHLFKLQFQRETEQVKMMAAINKIVLENIIPSHVVAYFMRSSRKNEDLYHESCSHACVMFASIPNFKDFYQQTKANGQGLECIRVLNEIISDFDVLLIRVHNQVEKIKTIGSTYMAATGLYTDQRHSQDDEAGEKNIVEMIEFCLAMMATLDNINKHSFNNFSLRIGVNSGPVIAGVIGARKPQYDIWGDTVNVASRMDSFGLPGKIQVPEDTAMVLAKYGYSLEYRGLTKVKGKQPMKTFFLHARHEGTQV
ncbi:hypothetical protein BsWGS_22658 [Bradybaena similaris]